MGYPPLVLGFALAGIGAFLAASRFVYIGELWAKGGCACAIAAQTAVASFGAVLWAALEDFYSQHTKRMCLWIYDLYVVVSSAFRTLTLARIGSKACIFVTESV